MPKSKSTQIVNIKEDELRWAMDEFEAKYARLKPNIASILSEQYSAFDDPILEADCIYGIILGLLIAKYRILS